MTQTDIIISGGGLAGLMAAAAFGAAGFRVTCIEPTPPVTSPQDQGADLRSTAILQSSYALLERAGIWAKLTSHVAPLQVMRIIDAGGAEPIARVSKEFDATDLNDLPFGWNFPNWLLRRVLLERLAELPQVNLRTGLSCVGIFTRLDYVQVRLSSGDKLTAKLLIGADGRSSFVRTASNIGVKTWRYGQKALAFAVTHKEAHHNISTEVHRTGGPFTLVPLPDDAQGRPTSAVVWMDHGPKVLAHACLDQQAFDKAITERSAGVLGPLTLLGPRSVWPIISQLADHLVGERMALMAEAARVVPPIGAQGLNMSLGDIACLLDLAQSHSADLGSEAMLAAYQKARGFEIKARVIGIDALNRASMVGAPALRDLRSLGLQAIYEFKPLRRTLMKKGLGLQKKSSLET
ncbi:MAG: UbiH/UbiF family hydroxylase [Paracoccaceae bacterium]|nr:UbiH/UbiF family hydroxylase [Paracoccaceae bacterium]